MASGERLFADQVAAALAALEVEPPAAYKWAGMRVDSRRDARDGGKEALIDRLADQLYLDFYCRGGRVVSEPFAQSPPPVNEAFRELLSDANTGSATSARGWTVTSLDGEEVRVERNGLELVARRDELSVPRSSVHVGGRVSVLVSADRRISPGYHLVTGAEGDCSAPGSRAIRIYFHVAPDGAAVLVGSLSATLNRQRIPFQLKLLADPLLFGRCDASVLMLPRRAFRTAVPNLRGVLRRLDGHLQPAVPAFTKRLGLGVGLAEDPDWKGGSFGASRCRLVAEGAVAASDRGEHQLDARLAAVEAAFARRGLRLAVPYLNAGSTDDYHL